MSDEYYLWDDDAEGGPKLAGGGPTVGECLMGATMLLELVPAHMFAVRDGRGEWYAVAISNRETGTVDVHYNPETTRVTRIDSGEVLL